MEQNPIWYKLHKNIFGKIQQQKKELKILFIVKNYYKKCISINLVSLVSCWFKVQMKIPNQLQNNATKMFSY